MQLDPRSLAWIGSWGQGQAVEVIFERAGRLLPSMLNPQPGPRKPLGPGIDLLYVPEGGTFSPSHVKRVPRCASRDRKTDAIARHGDSRPTPTGHGSWRRFACSVTIGRAARCLRQRGRRTVVATSLGPARRGKTGARWRGRPCPRLAQRGLSPAPVLRGMTGPEGKTRPVGTDRASG